MRKSLRAARLPLLLLLALSRPGVAQPLPQSARVEQHLADLQTWRRSLSDRVQLLAVRCDSGEIANLRIQADDLSRRLEGTSLELYRQFVSIRSQMDERERLCCASVTEYGQIAPELDASIQGMALAHAAFVSTANQELDTLRARESQVDADLRRLEGQRREVVEAILRSTGWFGADSTENVLAQQIDDPKNTVDTPDGAKIIITALGYFMLPAREASVRNRSGQQELEFHPLDLFAHDPTLAIYSDVHRVDNFKIGALYRPQAPYSAQPADWLDQLVDWTSVREWSWQVKQGFWNWLLQFRRDERDASVSIRAIRENVSPRQETAQREMAPLRGLRVTSKGWFSYLWEAADFASVIFGLLGISLGSLAGWFFGARNRAGGGAARGNFG